MDKRFFLNIVNTLDPGKIDRLIIECIKRRQITKKDDCADYIELSQEFRNIFDTDLYNLGPSKFMGLLRKRLDD